MFQANYLQILLLTCLRNLRLFEMRWIALAVHFMQMRLCNRKLQRDWPAARAKPPSPRAQNPLRPRGRGQRAPEPESGGVRLFINLMRDSISVITVMNPIVSFMRSLRHVLNSIQTSQCAVVPELLSVNEPFLRTNTLCQNYVQHNTTNCRLATSVSFTQTITGKTDNKASP